MSKDNHLRLISRTKLIQLLDIKSIYALLELERDGRLTPIRLTRAPRAHVYYSMSEVTAIIGGGGNE